MLVVYPARKRQVHSIAESVAFRIFWVVVGRNNFRQATSQRPNGLAWEC